MKMTTYFEFCIDSNKIYEIRCTKELEMLLSDSNLLNDLSGPKRNVSSINDKLPKFLTAFGLLFNSYQIHILSTCRHWCRDEKKYLKWLQN